MGLQILIVRNHTNGDNLTFIVRPVDAYISSIKVRIGFVNDEITANNSACTMVSSKENALNFNSMCMMERGMTRRNYNANGSVRCCGDIMTGRINKLLSSDMNDQ